MNRFKILIMQFTAILAVCIMCHNAHVAITLIVSDSIFTLLGFAYVVKNMNNSELRFFNNLRDLI